MVLECEVCENHACNKCLKINATKYEVMLRDDTFWVCGEACRSKIRELVAMKDVMNDLKVLTMRLNANASHHSPEMIYRRLGEIEESVGSFGRQLTEVQQQSPDEGEDTSPRVLSGKIEVFEDKLAKIESMLENMGTYLAYSPADEPVRVGNTSRGEEVQEMQDREGTGEQTLAKSTWRQATAEQPKSLRSIIREENEEALKEAERTQRRRKNIIIHRVPELKTEEWNARRQHDESIIGEIIRSMELDVNITDFYRLGKRFKKEEGSEEPQLQDKRPLLVSLSSEEERSKIMSSLGKLKNASGNIQGIRVSPDLSMQEREEIRNLVREAENRTRLEDGDFRHIVRGKQILRVRDRHKLKKKKERTNRVEKPESSMEVKEKEAVAEEEEK